MAAIDVGSEAIDRASSVALTDASGLSTVIDYNNPITHDGIITSVEIWLVGLGAAAFRVGTFYKTGTTTFVCRAAEAESGVTVGSKQTLTVALEARVGDYIGISRSQDTTIEAATSGGSGYYTSATSFFAGTSASNFTLTSGGILSLYGTGATIENIKVTIKPKDPYTVSLAPSDPYRVRIAPSVPYVVTISPPED